MSYKRMAIDADLWTYDIPFAAQGKDALLPFSWCIGVADQRLIELKEHLGCDEFVMFLTGDGNFRHDIAKRDTYKGNRNQPRPEHYQRMRDYLTVQYDAQIIDGMEADDAIGIMMTEDPEVICVSRDKDLRQIPGWHYSYSVGKQQPFGPEKFTDVGRLWTEKKSSLILKGGGLQFFYSQILTGDTVDNYKGAKGVGPKGAYKLLRETESEEQMMWVCLLRYKEIYAENGLQEFLEQADLAWMVRELHDDGTPVLYSQTRRKQLEQIWDKLCQEQ